MRAGRLGATVAWLRDSRVAARIRGPGEGFGQVHTRMARVPRVAIVLSMKTLFLARHAKASRDDAGLSDRDRPLDGRGLRDAPDMGRRLAGRGAAPQRIVSSPALRALTTARLLAQGLGQPPDGVVVDERLYASSAHRLLEVIHGLDDPLDRVMLVGHNPEFAELAHRLAKSIDDMPTCAVVELRFHVGAWSEVGAVDPQEVTFDRPKD